MQFLRFCFAVYNHFSVTCSDVLSAFFQNENSIRCHLDTWMHSNFGRSVGPKFAYSYNKVQWPLTCCCVIRDGRKSACQSVFVFVFVCVQHIFCEDCVATWFNRERTCPMCRANIVDSPQWRDGSTSASFQIYWLNICRCTHNLYSAPYLLRLWSFKLLSYLLQCWCITPGQKQQWNMKRQLS